MLMKPPASLDDCYCFAARQAARRITRLYEKHLAPAGLTSAQFSILRTLKYRPNLTMSVLANDMGMDRTTLLRAVKPLKRDKLVITASGETDSRQITFSLSEQGQGKVDAALRLWQKAQSEFEEQVGKARASRLRRELLDSGRLTG
jgi:DNA-binding MarR family transcriptional regulator